MTHGDGRARVSLVLAKDLSSENSLPATPAKKPMRSGKIQGKTHWAIDAGRGGVVNIMVVASLDQLQVQSM